MKKYKTEMHCHSWPVSRCALHKHEELVEQYLEFGYTTVVLTEHLNEYTFHGMDDKSLVEKMDYYLDGYRNLKKVAGDRLNILLGAEAHFAGMGDSDFLIYGADEEFFLNNPDIYLYDHWRNGAHIRNNGLLLFQAHPFRYRQMLCPVECLAGIEVYNGHIEQNSHNRMAEHWIEEYPQLIGISGSDHHDPWQYPVAGILTDEPITNNKQLVEILKSGNFELIRDEETRNKCIEDIKNAQH
ncbi:MAG: PHP domain-containing protein [Clostridia bacterium]|nr:PHP domain-containing protein [Clostridia bacterium]